MTDESRSRYRTGDLDTLAELWQCWHDAGLRMPADTWTTPSGLGDWTVRELYAHVARGVGTLADLLAQPALPEEPALSDAAGYFAALRSFDAAQVAATAREWAAARTDDDLVDAFNTTVLAKLPRTTETVVVRGIAGTIRLADYVVTRILEATVHLLDLGHVVPHASAPPPAALRRTVDVLADLSPPADFIRLATGRPSVPVFPVLT